MASSSGVPSGMRDDLKFLSKGNTVDIESTTGRYWRY